MELSIELLGPPRIALGGQAIRFDTRKATALLAYLALTGERPRREAIAALLWPEAESGRARAALRRTLSVASAVGPALRTEGSQLWLDLSLVRCDVAQFRQFAAARDLASLQRAADLAAAPFLEGFSLRDSPAFDEWQAGTADRIAGEASVVLGQLVRQLRVAGDRETAAARAREWVARDPLNEPAHAELMRLLAASGDRAGALRQYRALVRVLDRELGVEPLPSTRADADAIRAGETPSGPDRETPAGPRAGGPAEVPLVERESLLVGLQELWGRAGDESLLVAVTGEPGAGRTAVLDELAERVAGAGGRVLRAAGTSAESSIGLAVLADLIGVLLTDPEVPAPTAAALADLVPGGLPVAAPPALERLRLEHVRALVARTVRPAAPTLLVIDEAQLVDPSSAEVLTYLLRRLPRGVLAVVSWPRHAGSARLPLAVRSVPGMRQVDVPALSEAGVAAVLVACGSTADARTVLTRTGGIARLVREFAAAEGSGGFADARQIVASRVAEAGPLAGQLLAAAVVLDAPAAPELLREVSGRDEDEAVEGIEAGVRRGLLVEQESRYALPHALVRTAVLDDLSAARLRMLHRRAAEALQRVAGTPAGVVAAHYESAGLAEQAATWHWRAAADAARLAAHPERLAHLQRALVLGWPPAEVHAAIGDALVLMGRYDDALAAFERAAVAGDEAAAAAAEIRIAHVHDRLGHRTLALAHLASATEELERIGDTPALARAQAELALAQLRGGQVGDARASAARARELARVADSPVELARSGNIQAIVDEQDGRIAEALAGLEEAERAARRAGADDLLVGILANRARLLAGTDPSAGLVEGQRALELARTVADVHRLGWVASVVADLLHALGRDDEAQVLVAESAAAMVEVASPQDAPGVWLLAQW